MTTTRMTLPPLNAGAEIEELQVGPDKHGVRFSDGSGRVYRVIQIHPDR